MVARLGTRNIGPGLLVAGLVAVALFWIAYDNGSYGLESRSVLAIALWWAFVLAVALGLRSREPVSGASVVVGALLAALAAWTFVSLAWSPDAEGTFDEFNQVSLYLGTFALVTILSRRWSLGRWTDGLTVAVVLVAAVALVSRLFPGTFPDRDLPTFLPESVSRLSFPLGYWNGLAIFVALGLPLLLRIAIVGRNAWTRAIALAPTPLIACVVYLASSRGGTVTAVVALIVFLALTERRWTAVAALTASLAGAGAAIAVLLSRDELVNGPLGTDRAESQGRSAALLVALVCLAVAVLYAVGCRLLGERFRPGRTIGRVALVLVLGASIIGIAATDPVERFDTFKAPPGALDTIDRGDFVKAHLLSAGGSGRWQNWSAAIDEWRAYPVAGEGAGSYESWWAEHGSIALFVRNAHSLYLETLGELGLVGLALVVGLVAAGVGVGVVRTRRATGEMRVAAAALTAVFCAYSAAAGFDWVWELTAVSVLGFAALGLVSSLAAAVPAPLGVVASDGRWRSTRGRLLLGVVAILAAWGLIFAQAIPLLAQNEVADSQAAVERGDLTAALDAGNAARDIQPWASSPYLQLALVDEEAGRFSPARRWIGDAIDRAPRDWRLWLVAARLDTKLGRVAAAERSLHRAIALNPRSPLFTGLLDDEAAG